MPPSLQFLLRVNLRKVRPVYMKVKSKCQSFSKLDITFDSLVLGDHFVEKLFGPGCPAGELDSPPKKVSPNRGLCTFFIIAQCFRKIFGKIAICTGVIIQKIEIGRLPGGFTSSELRNLGISELPSGFLGFVEEMRHM